MIIPCFDSLIFQNNVNSRNRRVASGGAGGLCPPRFSFLPPRFFSCPPTVFFWEEKLVFLGGKNVKSCDLGQKKPSDFGEDPFFWRSPGFARKICDFGQKKPSNFGEGFFFSLEITCIWSENLWFRPEKAFEFRRRPFFFRRSPGFARKICDFGQKKPLDFGENLCPPDFNFAPPISRSWRRTWVESLNDSLRNVRKFPV